MAGWSHRPLFKNPTNMMGGGPVGMPKGISGYEQGSVVEEMPAYRQEQLAKEAEYQKEIEKTARLFSSSDPNRFRLPRDYESEIHWHAKNIAGGHQVPKEQVMQDLAKAIETQRGAPKMRHGGIVRLQTGGLFEGEEIVEINPMLNQMAGQGGSGIASVSAEPAPGAAPERNVPNERGIIELAMDAEEVEDDEPIIAFAKQEAKSKLDEEFNILKSTAQAEAAQGEDPSFIIKRSMDSLARSANVIEQEVMENYPEVPMDANLISSEDLEPYQQELVAVFETPEVGSEEPLMDTAILAKRGGLIPGYEDGGVTEVPEEWAWIDEDIRESGVSLKEAEALMIKKYGPEIAKLRKMYETETDPETLTKRRMEERLMPADELIKRRKEQLGDTRVADLVEAMKTGKFMGSTKPKILPHVGGTGTTILPMEAGTIKDNMELIRQYGKSFNEEGNLRPMPIELEEIVVDAKKRGGPNQPPPGPDGTTPGPDGTTPASTQSSSIQAALDAITDLQKGFEGRAATLETGIKKGAKDLTDVYDAEIEKSNTAITDANTAIGKTLVAYEKNIPELAVLRAQTSGKPSFAQRRTLAKRYELEAKNNAQDVRAQLAGLDKKAAEARRTNDVKALRDVKLAQLNAINSLREMSLGKGQDADLAMAEAELKHQLKLDEIRMEAKLAKTNTGVNQQLIDAMNDLKTRLANETDPEAKALLKSELDTYRTVVLGQKSPQAQITNALLEGNYKELFSAYSVEDMQRYAPSLQGEKTIRIEGKPAPITGTFPELYNMLVSQKKPNKDVFYTDKEIVEIWKRGTKR